MNSTIFWSRGCFRSTMYRKAPGWEASGPLEVAWPVPEGCVHGTSDAFLDRGVELAVDRKVGLGLEECRKEPATDVHLSRDPVTAEPDVVQRDMGKERLSERGKVEFHPEYRRNRRASRIALVK